MHTLAPITTL
jgi:hypothetical protein